MKIYRAEFLCGAVEIYDIDVLKETEKFYYVDATLKSFCIKRINKPLHKSDVFQLSREKALLVFLNIKFEEQQKLSIKIKENEKAIKQAEAMIEQSKQMCEVQE